MGIHTNIHWCHSTVNPMMGCQGCELFPLPQEILNLLDQALMGLVQGWHEGDSRAIFQRLITISFDLLEDPHPAMKRAVTTSNIWQFRKLFYEEIKRLAGKRVMVEVDRIIQQAITCYAAHLHLNKATNILNPGRRINKGYAPTFNAITEFPGRMMAAARFPAIVPQPNRERPWLSWLPRLIFVSDMGDAFASTSQFARIQEECIPAISSIEGMRHLWLWVTKRPHIMREFVHRYDPFPDNLCAMTTVTSRRTLYRVDQLREVDAVTRGLTIEPQWERIPAEELDLTGIHWVIVGGESGSIKHAREFAIEWAEELRDHCHNHGVAFFLKQLGRNPTMDGVRYKLRHSHGGDWDEWEKLGPRGNDLRVREFPQPFYDYGESLRYA